MKRLNTLVVALIVLAVLAPVAAQAAPPSNDNFADRRQIAAIPFSDATSTSEATVQVDEPTPSCVPSPGKSVWYEFTPAASQTLQADTLGSDYDTFVAVWTGSNLSGLSEVSCNDDAAQSFQSVGVFQAVAGTSYLIQVSGYEGDSGSLAFRLGVPTFGSISGTVRSESGEAIADACVDIYDPATGEFVGFAPTSPTGAYTASGLPDGVFQVQFSDECDEREEHFTEWYDNQPDHETAVEIPVVAPQAVTGIDATLSLVRLSVSRLGTGNGRVTSSGPGIDCGQDCVEIYEENQQITLTAVNNRDSLFMGWSGCDQATGNQCLVFMDAVRSVEATFDLDLVPPDTTITRSPETLTDEWNATFEFVATEPGATFECSLDAEGYGPCASPKTYTDMEDGDHTFRVRATDVAGNTDPSPASFNWTIDTSQVDRTPPETTITSGPSGTEPSKRASFTFTSSEENSTFACSLDGQPFSNCVSPRHYGVFPEGSQHTFRVRATDSSGNVDPSPASSTWLVDGEGPIIEIRRPTQGVYVNNEPLAQAGPEVIVVGSVVVEAAVADAESGVTAVGFEVDGVPVDPSQVTSSGGVYRFTYRPAAPGEHLITIRATNGSGLLSSKTIRVQGVPLP
jgi:hypothetical protein